MANDKDQAGDQAAGAQAPAAEPVATTDAKSRRVAAAKAAATSHPIRTIRVILRAYGTPYGESKPRTLDVGEVLQWNQALSKHWMVEVTDEDDGVAAQKAASAEAAVPDVIKRARVRSGAAANADRLKQAEAN